MKNLKLGKKSSNLFFKYTVDAMLLSLEDVTPENSYTSSASPTVERIINFINNNLASIDSAASIADALFISKSHMGRVFKNEMNVSVMEYVRTKKVVLAHRLISDGARPSDVYAECGFSNYPSFYRAYVSYFGAPPKSAKEHR